MREYTKISPLIWRDKRLASDDQRQLTFYYYTCEHQNSSGCCRIPDAYAVADLRWMPERYVSVRAELMGTGVIKFDPGTEEIWIVDFFESNPPMGPKHGLGCQRIIERISSDVLREEAEQAFEQAKEREDSEKKKTAREPANSSSVASYLERRRIDPFGHR